MDQKLNKIVAFESLDILGASKFTEQFNGAMSTHVRKL
jgi:hypothetical protein